MSKTLSLVKNKLSVILKTLFQFIKSKLRLCKCLYALMQDYICGRDGGAILKNDTAQIRKKSQE